MHHNMQHAGSNPRPLSQHSICYVDVFTFQVQFWSCCGTVHLISSSALIHATCQLAYSVASQIQEDLSSSFCHTCPKHPVLCLGEKFAFQCNWHLQQLLHDCMACFGVFDICTAHIELHKHLVTTAAVYTQVDVLNRWCNMAAEQRNMSMICWQSALLATAVLPVLLQL